MSPKKCKRLLLHVISAFLALILHHAIHAQSVDLGTADSFAVLAGSGISNTGPTTIVGDIGTHPNPAITNGGSITLTGTNHADDAVTAQAKIDLVTAYNNAAGLAPTGTITAGTLGGLTLVAGVYNDGGFSLGLTGTLTLDAQGNPDAVWVFQTGSTLITASNSSVVIINGGQACHIFWQVGSSATLGTNSTFQGNVLALTSITATTGASVTGRLLARNGAVTLDTNEIIKAICAEVVDTTPDDEGEGEGDSSGGSDAEKAAELRKTLLLAAQVVDIASLPGLTSIYTQGFSQFDTEVFSVQQRFADLRAQSYAWSNRAPDVYSPESVPSEKNPWSGKNPTGGKNSWGGKRGEGVQPKEVQEDEDLRWGFFIVGTGDYLTAGGANSYDGTTVGTAMGVDYRLSEQFVVGVSVGYSHTEGDLTGTSNVEADGGKAAVYAMYHDGGFFTEAIVGGGYNSYDIERSAFLGTARGETEGKQFDAYLGMGYDFKLGGWTITPMASVLYTLVSIDGYDEVGSLLPLVIESQDASSLRTRIGPRVAYTTKVGSALVTPSVGIQWQHEFHDDSLPFQARFANDSGSLFTVYGPEMGRDSLLLTAALNVSWKRYAAYIAYQASLGRENYENHSGLVGLRVSW
ncbi:ice-binding family protein [Verrucomicrobium sp. BvORR034]|uniref:ice-binding family protein n=1 Tax=Verrucomicrobium sp. BvORR034 TaxID=1396418 RepID=UPI0009DECCC3|nr:ice-binding family protein [Verrucomicrobium sp. BvORR034]